MPECHLPGPEYSRLLRSAGRPTPVAEVRIVDAQDKELPFAQIGEIVARGPMVMQGYWNRPAESEAALNRGRCQNSSVPTAPRPHAGRTTAKLVSLSNTPAETINRRKPTCLKPTSLPSHAPLGGAATAACPAGTQPTLPRRCSTRCWTAPVPPPRWWKT
ncbi:MAG: AMP-binding protein [Burkholderiaceae bacterium]|nr:AMP-binding protein [Burkholderiaceae bacterium]